MSFWRKVELHIAVPPYNIHRQAGGLDSEYVVFKKQDIAGMSDNFKVILKPAKHG